MSGFGKFSTIRYRFRRAILDSSCVTFNPRPLLFCDFRKDSRWCREIKLVHRWSGLHRRILETVPLLGITEREKMVLESVSGIAAQLHRFTVFTLSILLASLIHRYPPAFPRYRYSRSVNQSSKPERFRNCISFVSPWRAVRFISKQLRTLHFSLARGRLKLLEITSLYSSLASKC